MFHKKIIIIIYLKLLFFGSVVVSNAEEESYNPYSLVGAPFIEPKSCSTLNCTLNLDIYHYEGPYLSFKTRTYNLNIPGPIIRVKSGFQFQITVNNKLEDIDSRYSSPLNTYRHANLTGLHTHGLHVGSDKGGDDIFHEILPKNSSTYVYDLPEFHAGGTFWYHPHHHGSTALQTGGGAMGLIIVEDAENEIPPFLSKFKEKCIVINHINIKELSEIQSDSNTALLQPTFGSIVNEIMLVNGQTAPVMNINSEEWYRFRIVFSSASSYFRFQFDDDETSSTCEMHLIAKDGVYLFDAPRRLYELPLYSGARCDILVRCVGSPRAGGSTLVNITGFPNNDGSLIQEHVWNGTVLTLNVSTSTSGLTSTSISSLPSLPTFTINRPCYLIDTTNISYDLVYNTSNVDLNVGGPTINGKRFTERNAFIDSFPVGSLVELKLFGVRGHPFHLHINSFQITYVEKESDYFHIGDYHDTFFFGKGNNDPEARVRFFTDTFVGSMVLHCHLLTHEDTGMMAEMLITGVEGGVFEPAELIDPKCYRNASGKGYTVNITETLAPSSVPSAPPSFSPTSMPTVSPTTDITTSSPTCIPTSSPIEMPSFIPTASPSSQASETPTFDLPIPFPSTPPTSIRTLSPTPLPSASPSLLPTSTPTSIPTPLPSALPSSLPSNAPSILPSPLPKSCDSLDWNFTLISNSLCIGDCFGITSPSIALSNCETIGARLCTMEDMTIAQRYKGRGQYCENNEESEYIWTSTRCNQTSWLSVTSNYRSANTSCALDSELHFAQCCFNGYTNDKYDDDEDNDNEDEDDDDFSSSLSPTVNPTMFRDDTKKKHEPSNVNIVFSSIWGSKREGKYMVVASLVLVGGVALFVLFCWWFFPRKRKRGFRSTHRKQSRLWCK